MVYRINKSGIYSPTSQNRNSAVCRARPRTEYLVDLEDDQAKFGFIAQPLLFAVMQRYGYSKSVRAYVFRKNQQPEDKDF
jgi:hypothetical protein